ncbi:hypothetical protein ACFQH6_20580 [Halobacteriaceae archaeon GCM10025711]
MFDLYVVWGFLGLALVGGVAAYVFFASRLVTPSLGLGVVLGWAVLQQTGYRTALGELSWTDP